jgi:hypothetical protein
MRNLSGTADRNIRLKEEFHIGGILCLRFFCLYTDLFPHNKLRLTAGKKDYYGNTAEGRCVKNP